MAIGANAGEAAARQHTSGEEPSFAASKPRRAGTARDLRLSGWWLRAAGFDLGQACEAEVLAGTLVVRAV
jgi:hypothetical protein